MTTYDRDAFDDDEAANKIRYCVHSHHGSSYCIDYSNPSAYLLQTYYFLDTNASTFNDALFAPLASYPVANPPIHETDLEFRLTLSRDPTNSSQEFLVVLEFVGSPADDPISFRATKFRISSVETGVPTQVGPVLTIPGNALGTYHELRYLWIHYDVTHDCLLVPVNAYLAGQYGLWPLVFDFGKNETRYPSSFETDTLGFYSRAVVDGMQYFGASLDDEEKMAFWDIENFTRTTFSYPQMDGLDDGAFIYMPAAEISGSFPSDDFTFLFSKPERKLCLVSTSTVMSDSPDILACAKSPISIYWNPILFVVDGSADNEWFIFIGSGLTIYTGAIRLRTYPNNGTLSLFELEYACRKDYDANFKLISGHVHPYSISLSNSEDSQFSLMMSCSETSNAPSQWMPCRLDFSLCRAPQSAAVCGESECSTCASDLQTYRNESSECEPCPAGTIITSEGECVPCPAGTYGGTRGDSECLDCPAGTYRSTTGGYQITACVPCSSGTLSTEIGATSSSSCISCESEDVESCTMGSSVAIPAELVERELIYPSDLATASDTWYVKFVIVAGVVAVIGTLLVLHVILSYCCAKCGYCDFRKCDRYFEWEHEVSEGESAIKRKTALGALATFAVYAVSGTLLGWAIVDFAYKNAYLNTAMSISSDDRTIKGTFGVTQFFPGVFPEESCGIDPSETTLDGLRCSSTSFSCESTVHLHMSGCLCTWTCSEGWVNEHELLLVLTLTSPTLPMLKWTEVGIEVPHYDESHPEGVYRVVRRDLVFEDEAMTQNTLTCSLFRTTFRRDSLKNALLGFHVEETSQSRGYRLSIDSNSDQRGPQVSDSLIFTSLLSCRQLNTS